MKVSTIMRQSLLLYIDVFFLYAQFGESAGDTDVIGQFLAGVDGGFAVFFLSHVIDTAAPAFLS